MMQATCSFGLLTDFTPLTQEPGLDGDINVDGALGSLEGPQPQSGVAAGPCPRIHDRQQASLSDSRLPPLVRSTFIVVSSAHFWCS